MHRMLIGQDVVNIQANRVFPASENPGTFLMKTLLVLTFGLLYLCGASNVSVAQSVANQQTQIAVPSPTPYAITVQDANSRVWQRTDYQTFPSGEVITNTHGYTEICSGLNHLVNGKWVESSEQIDILPNGTAVATNGQHQAYFPGDIYQGQIELVTPDGQHLKSRPMGLSYFDGTKSVLIAELTNSIGVVVGNNQVIYPNAFTDFKADLRYTYTKAGFEQDIILRQQPPTPESMGLNPDTARLQILTEFFSPPQPTIQSSALPAQAGLSLTDQRLGFGAMQMISGRAFLLGANATDAGAMVDKQWLLLDGRQFLVEEVPVDAILEGLAALPLTAMNSTSTKSSHTASRHLNLPPLRLAKSNVSRTMMMAKAALPMQGFVLDYQTVSGSSTNYNFQGDTTYYISGSFYSYGANTFEGGAVIKYATNGTISIVPGPPGTTPGIISKSAAYRPVIFTAIDDNTVGDSITGSTGNPTGHYYGNPMLLLVSLSPVPTLTGIRMTYANTALQSGGGGSMNIYGAQFVNCQYGVSGVGATVNLRNALFANTKTNYLLNSSISVNAQNVTFSGSGCLLATPGSPSGCSLTLSNCIFANVTNLSVGYATPGGSYNGFYNSFSSTTFGTWPITSSQYPFQKVGGGSYYLTNGGSFVGQGTTNIDPPLLATLRTKTTRVPILYSNVTSLTNITLNPQATRDTNSSLDLGYHYDPLDYAIGGSDLYSNLTVTTGTAIGWFESVGAINSSGQGYAISLNKGANLTYSGTVTAPCWMARYDTVQEGSWNSHGYIGGLMLSTSGSGSIPQLNATFTKWSGLAGDSYNFRDNYANGTIAIANSEFYITGYNVYDVSSLLFTNCLFFRDGAYSFNYLSPNAPNTTFLNCTFYNGMLVLTRYAGQPASQWVIQNTAFDGTGFSFADNYNGSTNYTTFDYNAYNTNNNSGLSYNYPYTPAPTNRLWVIGAHDKLVGTYNWQSSWFGSFYQPTNSLLINMGSTNANLLGLYQFTTQTNQVKETNSIVDIGYHYVATDAYGNPLDTNGDGIPDYLEDANGNGIFDTGDLGDWQISPFGLGGASALQVFTPLK
jgi:archaellum component FlaF (FlaF/FlaG flagellin family)